MLPEPARKARGMLAYASSAKGRRENPGLLEITKRDFAALKLEHVVAEIVATAPPLTPEQRKRIAALLTGGGSR